MSDITIYHNPACTTSNKTLALLREKGLQPTVVEYMKTGWTRPQLQGLLEAMDAKPRDILRKRSAESLGVSPDSGDEALIEAMLKEPVLVERPIVVTAKGTVLCRPVERVLDIL